VHTAVTPDGPGVVDGNGEGWELGGASRDGTAGAEWKVSWVADRSATAGEYAQSRPEATLKPRAGTIKAGLCHSVVLRPEKVDHISTR